MDVVRLGKKGQVSLPKPVLQRMGLKGEAFLLVEVARTGAVLLKPTAV
jgi:bifunctional DNA-binding transcriptional regulator/antitoxin component of YhaV-PrlF toxin-antitoxin module